ncbi:hypothetical protein TNCV_4527451 [Trichonephila clavipes]|nr:hypothetical protein TNCV_4527451 [Trichonephila clavipes]
MMKKTQVIAKNDNPQQTKDLTRGMVIGLRKASWSIHPISAGIHLNVSLEHQLWKKLLEQRDVVNLRGNGATKTTSANVTITYAYDHHLSHLCHFAAYAGTLDVHIWT